MAKLMSTPFVGSHVMRGVVVVVTTFVLAVGLLISNPNEAWGDLPQPDGPPDRGKHGWCYLSGFNQEATADAAMTHLRNQTDVRTIYPGPCGSHTDVRWRQDDLHNAYGKGHCIFRRSNGKCDVYYATLDMAEINHAPRPNEQRRKTACHELGHTVGVRHYSYSNFPGGDTAHSCLRSGEVRSSWYNLTRYGHHHRTDHINPYFNY